MAPFQDLPRLPSRSRLLTVVFGLFLLVLMVYGWGIKNPFVRWDDGLLVHDNPAVRVITPQTIAYVFTHYDPELYIPVTFLTYQFDWLIGGGSTIPFHLGNLVLHVLNALLAGLSAYLLTRRQWVALTLALIFAVHPLNTEAVMWVSARKDVLAGFFCLLSFVLWLYAREGGQKSRWFFLGSVVAFLLALLSKVMVIPLPGVMLLVDWAERRFSWIRVREKIPFVLVAIVLGLVAVYGKTKVIGTTTLAAKILMAFFSSMFYLWKIVVPKNFSLLYPFHDPISITTPVLAWSVVGMAVLTIASLLALRRSRVPLVLFLSYLALVGPSFINFSKGEMDIYFASDRYAYLGAIPVILGVILALAWFCERRRVDSLVVGSVTAIAVIILSFVAHAQSRVWTDTATLMNNVIYQYPGASHVAYNNVCNFYRIQNKLDLAIENCTKAIEIRPHSKSLSNFGAIYRKLGQPAKAKEYFDKALALNPNSKDGHYGQALLLGDQKKYDEAIAEYQTVVTIDPNYEEAFSNMASLQLEQGKLDEAITTYNHAIEVNPFFPEAHYNRAIALTSAGKIPEAIADYEETIELNAKSIPARINLGILYAKIGKLPEARRQFEEILQLNPKNAAALEALRQLNGVGGQK